MGALALAQKVFYSEEKQHRPVCESITVAQRYRAGRGSRRSDPVQKGGALDLGPCGNERGAARVVTRAAP